MCSEWWLTARYRQHELPFLIAHLSLWTEDGRTRVDAGQGVPMLYGNLVSAVDQLEDMAGNQGLFFCFPDVSVRVRGRYQLGVTLMRISRQARCPAARRDAEAHQDGRVRRSQPGGERARPCRDALTAV